MKIICVVGARPNFMKMAPVLLALRARGASGASLVHTGQHYDDAMSRVFLEQLGLPAPEINLEVGSGTHARQTAQILMKFDELLEAGAPAMVVVAGDVNSTVACALAAAKRCIPVAHVEAGLRSRDRSMPEEINRIVTDVLSDLLFAPSPDAVLNLAQEGIDGSKIHFVGNPMIDSLRRHLPAARAAGAPERIGVERGSYALVTLHRPSNVDDSDNLRRILTELGGLARRLPVIFPAHPRTAERIGRLGLASATGVTVVPPLGYLEFLGLMDAARLVLTDSGGIQEETTALGVPCLTLRDNTERPITILEGTNRLIGANPAAIAPAADEILDGARRDGRVPDLWDGKAGERIADIIVEAISRRGTGMSPPRSTTVEPN